MNHAIEGRFWKKVNKTETCWLWTAATTHYGHGVLGVKKKTLRAHRLSYEHHHGLIPDGMFVLHRCRVPACVNPDHLFLGDKKEKGQHDRVPPKERFWDKVEKTDTCWLWKSNRNKKGYGKLALGGQTRKWLFSHRVSWEIHNGPIPDGMHVLHKCDVTNCVNPDHLFLGTNADNIADRNRKGRQARGETNAKAKLTKDLVEFIRILHSQGHTYAQLARRFGVTDRTIYAAVNRINWKHV